MPTYNRASTIERAIDSVLCQKIEGWELIVVDNYSTDSTQQIVSQYSDSRIKYTLFRNDGVIAASRNEGIKQSIGEYLAFLDSDDCWHPNKLVISLEWISKCPMFGLLYSDHIMKYHDDSNTLRQRRIRSRKINPFNPYNDLLMKGNTITTSTVIVRTDLMRKIGGFSEDRKIIGWEDYYAWLSLAQIESRIVHIAKPLVYYDYTGQNYSKNGKVLLENIKHISSILYNNVDSNKLVTNDCRPPWILYQKALVYAEECNYRQSFKCFISALYLAFRHGEINIIPKCLYKALKVSLKQLKRMREE